MQDQRFMAMLRCDVKLNNTPFSQRAWWFPYMGPQIANIHITVRPIKQSFFWKALGV